MFTNSPDGRQLLSGVYPDPLHVKAHLSCMYFCWHVSIALPLLVYSLHFVTPATSVRLQSSLQFCCIHSELHADIFLP